MEIVNVIDRVSDKKKTDRDWRELDGAMIHRVGVDDETGVVLGYDAVSISDHFTGRNTHYPTVARATGGQIAYSLMIGGDRIYWRDRFSS